MVHITRLACLRVSKAGQVTAPVVEVGQAGCHHPHRLTRIHIQINLHLSTHANILYIDIQPKMYPDVSMSGRHCRNVFERAGTIVLSGIMAA